MAARFRPTLAALWTFLAIALPTLAALLAPMPAVDLAYQLRAGREILDSGAIPAVDTWTYTIAGTPWTDQQWGAQVLLALVFRATGWSGLAILRAALVALAFGLLLLIVRRRNPTFAPRWGALLVLAAFVVASPALALRPQLFAIVLFAATLLILADRRAHPRRVWLIPILAIAWANLHGSFPILLVVLGIAVLGDWFDKGEWRISLAVTVVSALATLVNPFGLDVWGYVVRLATNPTIGSRVSEWRPPGLTDASGILFWLSVVVAALAVAALWRQRRSFPIPALLTLVAFAALGAITGRGLAWWPFAAVFVIAGFFPAGDPQRPTALEHRRSALNAFVMGLLIVAGVALLPFWRPIGPAGVPLATLSYAPQGIASYLGHIAVRFNARGARVFAPQHWGSWLELQAPALAYAVDSRIELFPTSVWTEYDTIGSAAEGVVTGPFPEWERRLSDRAVFIVVTEAGVDTKLEAAMAAKAALGIWTRAYSDADGTVWEVVASDSQP